MLFLGFFFMFERTVLREEVGARSESLPGASKSSPHADVWSDSETGGTIILTVKDGFALPDGAFKSPFRLWPESSFFGLPNVGEGLG